MPINKALYPQNWGEISKARRESAGNRCEWCGAANHEPHPITGSRVVLTVAHLDQNPANNEPANLAALCQRCHLNHDRPHNLPKVRRTKIRRKHERLLKNGQKELGL